TIPKLLKCMKMESSPLLSTELEGFIEKEIKKSSSDAKFVKENKNNRENASEKLEFMQKEDNDIIGTNVVFSTNQMSNVVESGTTSDTKQKNSSDFNNTYPFECSECESRFFKQSSLLLHKKNHAACSSIRKQSYKKMVESQISENKTVLEGSLPEKSYSDLNDLVKVDSERQHHHSEIINADNNTGKNCMKQNDIISKTPVECDVCHKVFQQLALLNKHKIIHSLSDASSPKHRCYYNKRMHTRKNKRIRPPLEQKPSFETCEGFSRIIHSDKYSYSTQKNKEIRQDSNQKSICEENLVVKQNSNYLDKTINTTNLNIPTIGKSYDYCSSTKMYEEAETDYATINEMASNPNRLNKPPEKLLLKKVKKSKIKNQLTHEDKTCPYCGLISRSRASLKIHVRIHTDEKPHKCVECHRSFRTATSLKTHTYSHTGERPYMCGIC
ncbi:unnamed protein product, partial [Meganyctiphanes norvegica]